MAKWLVRFGLGGKVFRKDITNGLPPEEEDEGERTLRYRKISAALKGKPRRKAVIPDGYVGVKQFAEMCQCVVETVYVLKCREKGFPKPANGEGQGHVLIWKKEMAQEWATAYLQRRGTRR